MKRKPNMPYRGEWHAAGPFALGDIVDVIAVGCIGAFRGVIEEKLSGTRGWYYHVRNSADGRLWHRVAVEMTAIEPNSAHGGAGAHVARSAIAPAEEIA